MSADPEVYAGIKGCGCIVAGVVNRKEFREDIAKDVAEFIKSGLTIRPMSLEDFRNSKFGCDCQKELII